LKRDRRKKGGREGEGSGKRVGEQVREREEGEYNVAI